MNDNGFFEARNKINYIENKHKLHFLKMNGVYVWGELRNYYFFKIINSNFHEKRRLDKSNIINILKIFHNNFSRAKKNTNLVILGHRKEKLEYDNLYDETTFEIRNLLNNYNVLDEKPFNGKYHLDYKNNVYHNVDLLSIRKLSSYNIKSEDLKKLEDINVIISEKFPDISFELKDVCKVIKRFMIDYKYYKKNLAKQEVKNLYLPSYYSHFALLMAAKDLKIRTIEIQYCSINKNHINYDFSTEMEIPYLPDDIILWSRYYDKEFLKYKNKYVINKKILDIEKEKMKKIVVISQDLIAEQVHEFAIELSKIEQLSEYEIILKQHPWEQPVAYECLKVIDSDYDGSVIDIISDAEIVISSFSTVIDEALQLGCKVILIENGFDKIVDLNYKLDKVKNARDILSLMPFKHNTIFKPFVNDTSDIKLTYNTFDSKGVE